MFKEATGNIWDLEGDGLCVTTNLIVKDDGKAVMGAGIAKQALERYPGVDKLLGEQLILFPKILVSTLVLDYIRDQRIITFPTKRDWRHDADIDIIKKSCKQLMKYVERNKLTQVLLPRPGCGKGNLDFQFVKNEIESLLDERIVVVTYE